MNQGNTEKTEKAPERRPVIFSGIQPSGDLTLGSYLGATKNWAERAAKIRQRGRKTTAPTSFQRRIQ